MYTKMNAQGHFCTIQPKNVLNVKGRLPERLITLSALVLLERDLIRKKSVTRPGTTMHMPFWFLGRMERDVFLWKSRLSLADADNYSYWLDPVRLAIKRLRALRGPMQLEATNLDSLTLERRYIKASVKAMLPKLPIIQALSQRISIETDERLAIWLKM